MSTPEFLPPDGDVPTATPLPPPLEPAWSWEPPPRPPKITPSPGDLGIFLLTLLGTTVLSVVAGFFLLLAFSGSARSLHEIPQARLLALSIPLQAAWYLVTLAALVAIFRGVWNRPFLDGIHWNGASATRHWWKLLLGGALLSIVVQAASSKLQVPHDAPVLDLFKDRWAAWMLLVFGITLAPAAEEVCFRGFFLPSLAKPLGTVVSATVTSLLFGLLHAQQLGHAWGLVAVLFCVSLVLCYVRIRLNSVAASTLFHIGYNGFIFVVTLIATHGFTQLDKLKM